MRVLFICCFQLCLALYVCGESLNYLACKAAVQNGSLGVEGTTDRNGFPTTNLSLIEGYQYQYCVTNCGSGSELNSYKTVSEQSTLWFLPWFLLLAQIPYFTQSKGGDFVVMLLTVGSPTTAFYSLFITILDLKWLKSCCNLQLGDTPVKETINDISEVLSSLHQFPVEIEEVGLLACTLRDRTWWKRLRLWFIGRRRHMEASAYAQLLLTVIVYCFAIIPEAFADLGDTTTAHGLAIGNLWMWLIPLVWGWFAVGTHHGRRREVVEKLHEKVGDIILPTNETADPNEQLAMRICDPEKPGNRILISKPLLDEDVSTKRRSIFGFSIGGDELADGPFYNYARCATWSHLAYKIIQAYANAHSILLKQASDSTTNLSQVDISGSTTNGDPEKFGIFHQSQRENATGDLRFARVLSECRIFQSGPLKRFGWKDSESDTGSRRRKVQAFFMAVVLQGVFGWSAFMIDYMTPTIGIGCRALICMTYSLMSLFSCLFLIIASHCSDRWSLQFERYRWNMEMEDYSSVQNIRETGPSDILAVGSIGFRLLGKTLAIFNSIFIVLGCILEFIGVYESCFCKSSYLGLRERAYVSFLSTQESAHIARPFWFGGAGAAMFAVLVVCFGYFARLPRATK